MKRPVLKRLEYLKDAADLVDVAMCHLHSERVRNFAV
jgi:Holliday junction resolvasome RuvABC endonuclease subunit